MSNFPSFPQLNESRVRKLTTAGAVKKGMATWQSGRVSSPMLAEAERTLFATVQDDAHRVFHVAVRHLAGEEFDVRCDCGEQGVCAHAAALLVNWALDRHVFTRAETNGSKRDKVDTQSERWREYLQHLSMAQLRAMARRLHVKPHGPDRDSLETPLIAVLIDPQTPLQALAQLTDFQRRVLQMLYLLSDGEPDTLPAAVEKALGWQGQGDVENALRELSEWGLVCAMPSAWHATDPYTIAPGIDKLAHLFGFVPAASATVEGTRDLPIDPFNTDEAGLTFSEVPQRIWEVLWLAERLPLRTRPVPPEPAQARNLKLLRQWPYVVDELVRLQVRPGWMHQSESVLTVPPPAPRLDDASLTKLQALTGDDEFSDFAGYLLAAMRDGAESVPRDETDRDSRSPQAPIVPTPGNIFAAWQQLRTWTELWPAQRHHGLTVRRSVVSSRQSYAGWLEQLAHGRRFVTRLLTLLPAGTWHTLESVLQFIHTVHPDFLRAHAPYSLASESWWLESQGKKVDPDHYDAWRAGYARFVEEMLGGPLCWMGAVELASEQANDGKQNSALRAFRITPDGAVLLRGHEPAHTNHEPALVLTGDLTARLPMGRGDLHEYQALGRFAQFDRVAAHETYYCFTIRSAHRAFESGLTAGDVLSALEKLSGKTAPDAVAKQWHAWWGAYARTRLYDNLTVIEFADDYVLQELLSQSDLQEHLLFTFGPRLVAVRPESAEAIARQLVKKGYTPMLA